MVIEEWKCPEEKKKEKKDERTATASCCDGGTNGKEVRKKNEY